MAMRITRPITFIAKQLAKLTIKKSLTLTALAILTASTALTTQNLLQKPQLAKAATTPESCFAFNPTTQAITNYYRYEGNVSTNPTCSRDVVIPGSIGGVSVLAIAAASGNVYGTGASSFAGKQLTSVEIPDSVVSIGNNAFMVNSIASLKLGEALQIIGTKAFDESGVTAAVVIPDSVISIGQQAFQNNSIPSLTLGTSVQTIGQQAFQDNELTTVTIPSSVVEIKDYAFDDNKLTTVTIQDGVISIGNFAFRSNQLNSAVIPNSVASMGVYVFQSNNFTELPSYFRDSGASVIPSGTFQSNKFTNLTIPDNITVIDSNAFRSNQLSSVSISYSVATVGDWAFYDNQLASLTFGDSSQLVSIGEGAFYSNQLTSVFIPSGVITIGDSAFSYNQLASVAIPSATVSIGNYSFYNNQLAELVFSTPSQLDSIGYRAFPRNQLTTLTIPNSVTTIGNYAFGENQLTSLTLGTGLTSIPWGAFYANKLTSVTIPSNITSIHPAAFFGQNPKGGDIENDSSSPYYIWSSNPATVQAVYDSIWYVALHTEDPTNPNNLQPATVSEWWWWGSDANNNGHQNDSLGGHLINPTSATINYTNSSNTNLTTPITYTGQNIDGSYITTYLVKDNIFPAPLDHENPTTEEQAALQAGLAKYFSRGATLTITPQSIPGYITPEPITLTLSNPTTTHNLTYLTQAEVDVANSQNNASDTAISDRLAATGINNILLAVTASVLMVGGAGMGIVIWCKNHSL